MILTNILHKLKISCRNRARRGEAMGKRAKASRRIRLEDLAQSCGVSISTVSRVLSGGAGVRAEVAEKVQRAAAEYAYLLPSSLAGQKIIVVASRAAMIDYARNQFTLNVMQGVEERARLLRAQVSSIAVSTPEEERAVLDQAARDPDTAGLLFLTLDDQEMLAQSRDFPKPIVLLNGDDPLMQHSSVAPSNRAAGALACDHLIALGHRRILFLMRRGRRTIERRFEGWRDRMMQAGTYSQDLVVETADWLPDLAQDAIARRLVARDFTAILAASDSLALGALQALGRAGISVPHEVSVMGMDGLPQSAFLQPPLCAIQMPMVEIGGAAVELLRDLKSGLPLPARRIELACRLQLRGSTGPMQ